MDRTPSFLFSNTTYCTVSLFCPICLVWLWWCVRLQSYRGGSTDHLSCTKSSTVVVLCVLSLDALSFVIAALHLLGVRGSCYTLDSLSELGWCQSFTADTTVTEFTTHNLHTTWGVNAPQGIPESITIHLLTRTLTASFPPCFVCLAQAAGDNGEGHQAPSPLARQTPDSVQFLERLNTASGVTLQWMTSLSTPGQPTMPGVFLLASPGCDVLLHFWDEKYARAVEYMQLVSLDGAK